MRHSLWACSGCAGGQRWQLVVQHMEQKHRPKWMRLQAAEGTNLGAKPHQNIREYRPQKATLKGPSMGVTPPGGKDSLSSSSVCSEWQQVWPLLFNAQEAPGLFHLSASDTVSGVALCFTQSKGLAFPAGLPLCSLRRRCTWMWQ